MTAARQKEMLNTFVMFYPGAPFDRFFVEIYHGRLQRVVRISLRASANRTRQTMNAPTLCWEAAGRPEIHKKFKIEPAVCLCATCGTALSGDAVTASSVDNSAFSERHESFKYKSAHVCIPCAWLYGAGPSKPGNFFCTPDRFEQTVISLESVVEDKRPWLHALQEAATLPPDTPCAGVLTTDVKPRLWPRAQLAAVGSFGLFVHAPDYDTSHFISFDLQECLHIIELVRPALLAGFAKTSLYHGLLRDYQRFSKNPDTALSIEQSIAGLRKSPAFLPAILIAGVTKEEIKNATASITRGQPEPATKGRNQDSETQPRLF